MTVIENNKPPAVRRLAIVVAIVVAIGLAASAFILSFAALWDVSDRVWPRNIAALGPIVVDGTIVLATISLVALADSPIKRERSFFWGLLTLAAATSVGGNALHAVLPSGQLHPLLAALIATIPPAFLLLSTHGLVILIRPRHNIGGAFAEAPGASVAPAVAPEPVDTVGEGDVADRPVTPAEYVRAAEALRLRHELRTDVSKIAYILSHSAAHPDASRREVAAAANVTHNTVDRILKLAGEAPIATVDQPLEPVGAR
ncbi:DUF2637 domain-containing protein [Williamsia sp. MIQD14]|uniref:DUF2637 domain-containing protein n=1 Tax=Williamsia sp. MIQD14 TaxID=3425703 RepID=UPI003DA12DB2